ncbi:XRN 5'-3' exonuclease N-terminus domain containing protein [Tylopilus felleus]
MGVPALFRWLSKKYPKIVTSVREDDEVEVPDALGEPMKLPVDITAPNPNGVEFDNLYLDMNGIVHPCTHPEGKPPPETEEDMMVEVFKYTNRIVNMIRPRKLLFMAIDGVAPRAKMNQQRSRRFRSAQEAKDKAEARRLAVAEWEAMGKVISDEEKNKEAWDSNAITPGTPFMDLLASSLRYWVVEKMNTDPGWKDLQVIISDASVPGEGEHKIMDFIRRQRANQGHDPNTKHVIYGLDADLIMLALATHEPHFRVLREDVFAQDKSTACRICGEEGHYAAQCPGPKPNSLLEKKPKHTPPEKKPFIFLDVSILREYLETELYLPRAPFSFNFEQAIDDWVLLIFFVGNDFLPHLPSLEIREGAIDTLLNIWKMELPRMGGYVTDHGKLVLERAEIILEGLARREDDIFRKRQEAENRQDHESKRRRIDNNKNANGLSDIRNASGPSPALGINGPLNHNFAAKADSIGLGAPPTSQSVTNVPAATQALAGSNRDVVANRAAIRLANMSAAEVLKAELAGLVPVKPSASSVSTEVQVSEFDVSDSASDFDVPGLGNVELPAAASPVHSQPLDESTQSTQSSTSLGQKRSVADIEAEDAHIDVEEDIVVVGENDSSEEEEPSYAMVVRADGSVEQVDNVRLYEPGYKERYYQQKFGLPSSDADFRKKLTQYYVEGIAWVLDYYYQGTPSWQWYYPFHFAPFASDFEDLKDMKINFTLGQPFKPYEQLMGVFPPASKKHIPAVFHDLMTEPISPIIDFYPASFSIDMNGKKMLWQGVALLPFIDEKRLLDAMSERYPSLTEDEVRRNSWGSNVMYVSDEHRLYPFFESLYGKRKDKQPVSMPLKDSKGISGSALPNPDCIPGSTFYSPLTSIDMLDIKNDRSLSVLYYFPRQLTPHRSMLLPGLRKPPPQLTAEDLDPRARRGARGGRGGGDRDPGRGGPPRGGYGNGPGGPSNYAHSNGYSMSSSYGPPGRQPYPPPSQHGFGGHGWNGRPPPTQNYGGGPGGGQQGPPRGGSYRGPPRGGYGQPSHPPQSYGRGGYGGGGGSHGGGGGSHGGGGGGYSGQGGYGGYGPSSGYGRGGHSGGGSHHGAARGRGRGGW